MKSLYFFILLFNVCFLTNAQEYNSEPTKEEEYNSAIESYKKLKENNTESENGFKLERLFSESVYEYKFRAYSIIRENTNQVAVVIIEISSSINDEKKYLCIPHGNKKLNEKYLQEVKLLDGDLSKSYASLISIYFTDILLKLRDCRRNQ